MAAALFNQLVNPSKARALSAGTAPGERVHPEVADAMREVGIDLGGNVPTRLTDELAQAASVLVTMGCGDACPYVPGIRIEDWPLEDPKGKPMARVRAIRDEIRQRVQQLIAREGWG
jgi:arsenate reductase